LAVRANGSEAIAVQTDLSKLDDIRTLFQETMSRFGKLDILVINGGAPRMKPIVKTIEEEFDSVFTFNAEGNFFTLQEAAKPMADGGCIVTFSTPYTSLDGTRTVNYGQWCTLDNFELLLKEPKYEPVREYWKGLAKNEFHLYEVVFTQPAE
jgi:3-oxoacyl-[acyl-carrier protein] reductase